MLGGLGNSCAKSQIRYLWYLLDQIENCSFERTENEGSFSSRDNDDVQNATLDQGRVLSPPTTLHIHTCTLYMQRMYSLCQCFPHINWTSCPYLEKDLR